MTTVAVALVFLGVFLVVVSVLMVGAYLRQRIEWKRAPGVAWRWAAVDGASVDESRLVGAVESAWVSLSLNKCFSASVLLKAAEVLHVCVQRVPKWHSPQHGGEVAGVTSGHVIYVGSDLASVCHELAHVCEFLESGTYDFAHQTWADRGIQRAVDEWQTATGRR